MSVATLELEDMRQAAAQACSLMKVLANPDRLMILCQLSQGEKRVGELEELLGIVQPTLSQQLTELRDERLVSTRREGEHLLRPRQPKSTGGDRDLVSTILQCTVQASRLRLLRF